MRGAVQTSRRINLVPNHADNQLLWTSCHLLSFYVSERPLNDSTLSKAKLIPLLLAIVRKGNVMKIIVVALLTLTFTGVAIAETAANPIRVETIMQSTTSWDGTPYKSYPVGQPQITVLKITIAPHTTMKWHTHPMPNAAYVLSGELIVQKIDGAQKHFTPGQVITEMVDSKHRGITGTKPAVLIVFYPGTPQMPLSK